MAEAKDTRGLRLVGAEGADTAGAAGQTEQGAPVHYADKGTTTKVIRPAANRALQQRKPNPRVPPAKIRLFLATLAETCNVKRAAEHAGVPTETLYWRRRHNPAFAEAWRQALAIGYERLEEELLRLSLSSLTEGASLFDPKEALQPGSGLTAKANGTPDVQLALLLLNRHRASVEGTGQPHTRPRRATAEQTDALLRKKLDALAKRLATVEK